MVLGHDDANDDDDDNADSEPAISEEGGRYRRPTQGAWRRASHRASPYLAAGIAPCVAESGVVRHSLRRPCLATCVSPCVARVRRKELCSLRTQARRKVVGAQVPAKN